MSRRSSSPRFVSHPQTLSPNKISKQHTVHHQDKLKVFVKFKPQKINEYQQVRYVSQKQVQVKTAIKNKMYQFDYVFGSHQDHRKVFDVGCKQLIDQVMEENQNNTAVKHGLIFVYGNTGTGKTYSMGLLNSLNEQSQGIVPNSLKYIFNQIQRKRLDYEVSLSFSQIYMDQIYDLLAFDDNSKLSIREDSKTKQPFIDNQTIITVSSANQAYQILNIGLQKRRVAQQRLNRKSSRGHGLITINLTPISTGQPGKICFIDLAGCERLKQTQSKGLTLQEALHINSSLSSLQTLLMRISEQYVRDYRSSKLTRVLQPYFERGSINLFVTTSNDNPNPVQFGKRCKGIKFMERDLTPVRKSVLKEQKNRQSKQKQQLLLFRTQAIIRQKKLVSCIAHFINLVNKLSKIEDNLSQQILRSKFSLSQILGNNHLETTINDKIKEQQSFQSTLIENSLKSLRESSRQDLNAQEILRLLNQPLCFVTQLQDQAQEISKGIRTLAKLAQKRNLFKKDFFTSELKLNLLENRCFQLDDGLRYLTKYMDTTDKRVIKRLTELGLLNGKQNIVHQKTKQAQKSDLNKKNRSVCKHTQSSFNEGFSFLKQQNETPSQFVGLANLSQRRGAIYIDQI